MSYPSPVSYTHLDVYKRQSSDSSKVKVTATGDNEAVITAVSKTEAGKEVTITATTTDGTQKVGEIKVAVKEGINADSISFDSKLPEITYEGAGDLARCV